MKNLLISWLVFTLVFGGALAGMAVRPLLSEHHLHSDSKDVVTDSRPDRHPDRTRTGSVDRIRKNHVRPEDKPGQAADRNGHPSGRSADAIRAGSDLRSKTAAAEHTTDG